MTYNVTPRRQIPLYKWMGVRMSALAVGAVMCIAAGMWLHFKIKDAKALARLPIAEQVEVKGLVDDPHRDEKRLWRLFEEHYNIENFLPGLRNPDWFALLVLLLSSIPFIFAFGFIISASLARQFTEVSSAAKKVAQGDYSTRARVNPKSPGELVGLAEDFNGMSSRLEKNEREVRESSAMLAHELRTPLNAAMGTVTKLAPFLTSSAPS